MEHIIRDLEKLCCADGVAGLTDIVDVCRELLGNLVDEVSIDNMGNLLAVRRCADPTAPTLMLEAHVDEIGFLVSHIDDNGFLYVEAAGGVDQRVLTAQPVTVYGDKVYRGIFSSTPPHLAGTAGDVPELSTRGIDVGLSGEKAKAHIPLGSRVAFAPQFTRLNGNVVCSKALDNRAGIAAILHCLRQLDDSCPVNVAVALCVQEELGCRGSVPAVNSLKPDAAIVVDVSFATTHDSIPHHCGKLSNGPMIGISAVLNTAMTKQLQQLATNATIPQQAEVMGGATGTDADRISIALLGVPTALLSIPLRYMHTPVEVVDAADVAATGELMAAYIKQGGL